MSKFSAEPSLAGLKTFQRATVDHVAKRFYEDDPPASRFLVADETGLGKSLVGRGVIARAIEVLQDDDDCPRIDVVYVCSNTDIAAQNLKRLDVLEAGSSHHATRLTLLARGTQDLNGPPHSEVGKRVNLVSFTPRTSFDMGHATGRAEERALLHVALCDSLDYTGRTAQRAAAVVLQGNAGLDNFERVIKSFPRRDDLDDAIITPFLGEIRRSGLRRRFARAVDDLGRRTTRISDAERSAHTRLVGELRAALARAGIEALEPDLVILDEFQRFRHLLALDDPHHEEAAELANLLFGHGDAKVLLLSATPYKPFTYAEERDAGDDHEADLRRTLGFLAEGNGGGPGVENIIENLAAYRRAAIDGAATEDLRERLEGSLTSLMCRTERPRLGDDGMLHEALDAAEPVPEDDLLGYVALRRLADELDAPVAVDYWKSTPYFVNFGDGYKLGVRLRDTLDNNPQGRKRLKPFLRSTQTLDGGVVEQFGAIDPGNARLRRLSESTVGMGWWRLLWVPPSAPYDDPDGPFAADWAASMTKRLIFSSWTATPTAIASLISYEASRQIARTRAALDGTTARFDWRVDGGRPGAMTTLALFWPSTGLAEATDPFTTTSDLPPAPSRATGAEPWYWTTIFSDSTAAPAGLAPNESAAALSGELEAESAEHHRLELHARLALDLMSGDHDVDRERRTGSPDDLDAVVRVLGRFGPGNVAYRCLKRLTSHDPVSAEALWKGAATLAGGFRTLFNRPETILLLDQLIPDTVYWRAVLQYCAWGNLEATLDEFLHHLAGPDRLSGLNDEKLLGIANEARSAITPRPSRYVVFDPHKAKGQIPFPSRFALRYGSKRAEDEGARPPEIRAAFNSPFWPFVLATTSVGQEGIDFHWWCHAAVHWNTPASPVDFEQREGRIHRYGGHAIRRNLAARHRPEMLAEGAEGRHPWDAAYEAGARIAGDSDAEMSPHWITEGDAKIERHLLFYPLSHDKDRYRRLKEDLAVYRLTFGQPRQEDLADLLKQRGVHLDEREIERLRLDLRPPEA